MTVSDANGKLLVAKPSNSLSPIGYVWLFMSIAAINATAAVGFALAGAWLVLPFAGLELLAFGSALVITYLHHDDYESIAITDDVVVIQKHSYKNFEKFTFQRYWAKVTLRQALDGANAIFIGSHGKEVEFGSRFIIKEERAIIAEQLKQQLKII
ncbi:MAG: DUF2244 domain-containing protein [Betaproteobacteria bacterium HGW-Betaproteobacteria-22]|nr:MAG: DUF2244 domain-containing protein [Betaproteobacteria bacterium HGW-Betaproteobacteria-22]